MRVVNPVTPDLGGPQVTKAAGWLARTGTRLVWSRDRGKRSATSIFPQPFWVGIGNRLERADLSVSFRQGTDSFLKGLILAQNERWRRGLGMQVERIW